MHGRSRTDRAKEQNELTSNPQAQAALKEKLKRYQLGSKSFFDLPETERASVMPIEHLDVLLKANVDLQSGWNTRKQSIISILETTPEKRLELLQREINFTTMLIKEKNAKSYCTWYHRRWCILNLIPLHDLDESTQQQSCLLLKNELHLCDELLKRDERNFHCWGYRTLILEILDSLFTNNGNPSSSGTEDGGSSSSNNHNRDLITSQTLIQQNLGNGSAWQLRARYLDTHPQMFNHKIELDLVHNAIYTEPADQSPWIYYRFLLSRFIFSEELLVQELQILSQLLEEEGGIAKWPILGCIQVLSLLTFSEERRLEISEKLQKLMEIDSMHVNFYKDVLHQLKVDGNISSLVLNLSLRGREE
jgi:geranylgeranyl transferase type-2 subunit alpha